MNKQEIFNRVWNWFITKRNVSGYNGRRNDCDYLSPQGNRCAVGALLPRTPEVDNWVRGFIGGSDSLITSVLSEPGVPTELREWVEEYSPFRSFLNDLQRQHDSAAMNDYPDFHAILERNLRSMAEHHNLEVPA